MINRIVQNVYAYKLLQNIKIIFMFTPLTHKNEYKAQGQSEDDHFSPGRWSVADT